MDNTYDEDDIWLAFHPSWEGFHHTTTIPLAYVFEHLDDRARAHLDNPDYHAYRAATLRTQLDAGLSPDALDPIRIEYNLDTCAISVTDGLTRLRVLHERHVPFLLADIFEYRFDSNGRLTPRSRQNL